VRLGLIDEYVLHVHTVAIGAGKPLFTQQAALELVSARTCDRGVIQLRYQPAGRRSCFPRWCGVIKVRRQ
jgi:dihydrofolate reductase